MTKQSKQNVKNAVAGATDVKKSERTISLKSTVDEVVNTYHVFKHACSSLEGKGDYDTFMLSFKTLDKKIARLNNKASRNDVLKALREGKTVIIQE